MSPQRHRQTTLLRSLRDIVRFIIPLFVTLIIFGCRPRKDETSVEVPQQTTRTMVWGGESLLGYLRVELWAGQIQGQVPTQELAIYYFDGKITRQAGFLIDLPREHHPTPGKWRAFVRVPEMILTNHLEEGRILAVMSPDGGLRLYPFSAGADVGALELHPIR